MKCPYCNREMETGLIQSPHEISWLNGQKKFFSSRARYHDGSVVLSEFNYIKGSAVKAYLCRHCEKVLIDYADKTSDYNAR